MRSGQKTMNPEIRKNIYGEIEKVYHVEASLWPPEGPKEFRGIRYQEGCHHVILCDSKMVRHLYRVELWENTIKLNPEYWMIGWWTVLRYEGTY